MLSSNHEKEIKERIISSRLISQTLNYIQGLELSIVMEGFHDQLTAFKSWLDEIYASYTETPRDKFNQAIHQKLFTLYLEDMKEKLVSDRTQITLQLQTQIKEVERILKERWHLFYADKANKLSRYNKIHSLASILTAIEVLRLTFMTENNVASFWPGLTSVVTVGGYSRGEAIFMLLAMMTFVLTMWAPRLIKIPKQPETVVFDNNYEFPSDWLTILSCKNSAKFDSEIFRLVKPPLQTFFESLPQPEYKMPEDKNDDREYRSLNSGPMERKA